MVIPTKLPKTSGPSISRPPLQLRDPVALKDGSKLPASPKQTDSVSPTTTTLRSPVFNQEDAGWTPAPTVGHALDGLQTRAASMIQNNSTDIPTSDIPQKEPAIECVSVQEHIPDTLQKFPSSFLSQGLEEPKTEKLEPSVDTSSNTSEDADTPEQNVENWILSHLYSDGYDEHCKFVGICRFRIVLLENLPWSGRTDTVGTVIIALEKLEK